MGVKWQIDYWDGQLPLSSIKVEDGDVYSKVRSDGVVFLHIRYSQDGHDFHMKLLGGDNYYVFEKAGNTIVGLWVDTNQPWASAELTGREYVFDATGARISADDFIGVPSYASKNVKLGVMIPDDEARELGIIT